jgi:hypothetical protein
VNIGQSAQQTNGLVVLRLDRICCVIQHCLSVTVKPNTPSNFSPFRQTLLQKFGGTTPTFFSGVKGE